MQKYVLLAGEALNGQRKQECRLGFLDLETLEVKADCKSRPRNQGRAIAVTASPLP